MDPLLSNSLSKFAARFANELEQGESQVCSPLSAQALLALTALGSGGDTRDQLLQAMALPDDEAIRSLFSYVTSSTKAVEGVTLKIANKIYVAKRSTLKEEIQKDAEEVFGSSIEQMDFTKNLATAVAVNEWVAEQTQNMIKNTVDPNNLDMDTRLLLISAIYFQGLWDTPFSEANTKDSTFHVNLTTEIKVPMMSDTNRFFLYKHSPGLKAQILQMPYKDPKTNMVIVLPDEVEGLRSVLEQLAAGHDLMNELTDMRSTLMHVKIPKFKIETDIDLTILLAKLGINLIFDTRKANINMLKSNEPLYVSKAIQRAVIEVDEKGTEAGAETKIHLRMLCRKYPIEFYANRSFLFVLMVEKIPIFSGIFRGKGGRCKALLDHSDAPN